MSHREHAHTPAGMPAWYWPPDYVPAGDAEWSIETPDSIALGWVVKNPLGPHDEIMVVSAHRGNGRDGGCITISLKNSLDIAV